MSIEITRNLHEALRRSHPTRGTVLIHGLSAAPAEQKRAICAEDVARVVASVVGVDHEGDLTGTWLIHTTDNRTALVHLWTETETRTRTRRDGSTYTTTPTVYRWADQHIAPDLVTLVQSNFVGDELNAIGIGALPVEMLHALMTDEHGPEVASDWLVERGLQPLPQEDK